MNRKVFLSGILTLLMSVILLACSGNPVQQEDLTGNHSEPESETTQPAEEHHAEEGNEEGADEEPADSETAFPLIVIDDSDEDWELAAAPERIVSTSPAETEILFALGLGDKIVAVSDYCEYPLEALEKDKIGEIVTPDLEAILAADPDLVVTGISLQAELVPKMRELGLNVFKSGPESIADVMTNIERIGRITNTQAEAKQLIAAMQADIDQVKAAVEDIPVEEKTRVYVEFSPGWTVGSGEFLHELIEISGAVNIAEELAGWNQINEEKIIEQDPQVILYPEGLVDFDTNLPLEKLIKERNGWDQIDAINNDRVYGLDHDLLTIPGARITKGLLEMARAIYPDRME